MRKNDFLCFFRRIYHSRKIGILLNKIADESNTGFAEFDISGHCRFSCYELTFYLWYYSWMFSCTYWKTIGKEGVAWNKFDKTPIALRK